MSKMWQLARLLQNSEIDGRRLLSVGDTIWVKVGPPTKAIRQSLEYRRNFVNLAYDTNVQSPKGYVGHPLMACQADKLELQQMFRDEIPLIPYEDLFRRQLSLVE